MVVGQRLTWLFVILGAFNSLNAAGIEYFDMKSENQPGTVKVAFLADIHLHDIFATTVKAVNTALPKDPKPDNLF